MFERGRRLADWDFTPLEALRRWPRDRRVMMLHSGRFHQRWARWSILAEPVWTYQFTRDGRSIGRRNGATLGGDMPRQFAPTHHPFADLRALLGATEGLWIGYLGYDLGRWIERLPDHARADRDWPIVELGYCPGYLVHDLATDQWRACGTWAGAQPHEGPDLASCRPRAGADEAFTADAPQSTLSRGQYESAVQRVLDYIASGDVFQVNLTQRFTATFQPQSPGASRALFDRLAQVSPAWYGAYLELTPGMTGDKDQADQTGLATFGSRPGDSPPIRALASTSPELFLQLDAAGRVLTRPIKGTLPASRDPEALRRSVKDEAELNMIVDLLRNDLGRVCSYGSVRVTEPRTIETHPTIHHGVATIEGRLHSDRDVVDLLRATMPGGSITGAPKVRAMEIIDELEPVRRGPYCGAIGFLSRDAACLNVAIRTMAIDAHGGAGRVDFGVGGGIVADSTPTAEYEESLAKASAMLQALNITMAHATPTSKAAAPGSGVRV